MKIRAGYAAFIPPGDPEADRIFRLSLEEIRPIVDEVRVIWGRYRDRADLPPRDPPPYLRKRRIDLTVADLENPQPRQRDLYLEGLDSGDILLVVDSDWVPKYPGESVWIEARTTILSSVSHADAGAVHIYQPNNDHQCLLICIYRYRPGYVHGPGQLLEWHGVPVARPFFDICELPPGRFRYIHHKQKGR